LDLRVAEVDNSVVILEQVDLVDAYVEGRGGGLGFGGESGRATAASRTWNDSHTKAL
jgi:hypothetical protein